MKFLISKTSDWFGANRGKKEEKIIKTFKEFIEFAEKNGNIIIFPPSLPCNHWEIEIYDDYRE